MNGCRGEACRSQGRSGGPRRGEGRTLVLLHGQPGSGADWRPVVDRLPPGLATVALDRPGYGASDRSAGGFGDNAAAVVAELDARGIERAVLAGHSYGGGVALAVAELAPERVEALILLASVGPGCVSGWDRLLAAPVAGEVCAVTAWRLTPWLARAALAWMAHLRGRPASVGEHAGLQVWGQARPPREWRSFLTEQRALVNELGSLTGRLAQVRQPVLLISDPRDALVPAVTADALAAALPHARVLLLEDTGHHLPSRAAAQVAAAITGFLAEQGGRPPGHAGGGAGPRG